ncbi:Hypothetical protein FKW44_017574, partial [Caligus rogercresseyi]
MVEEPYSRRASEEELAVGLPQQQQSSSEDQLSPKDEANNTTPFSVTDILTGPLPEDHYHSRARDPGYPMTGSPGSQAFLTTLHRLPMAMAVGAGAQVLKGPTLKDITPPLWAMDIRTGDLPMAMIFRRMPLRQRMAGIMPPHPD